MLHGEMDDVRDPGDNCQMNADTEHDVTDMAEVRPISDSDGATASNGGGKCDSALKPTAAPLSSRASAFSIAALMKETSGSGQQRQNDIEGRHGTSGSLYDIAADHWQQQDKDYSSSGEVVKTKSDTDYWLSFNNGGHRRTYIRHV